MATTPPDAIHAGQTWTARYQTGTSVRITVVTDQHVGFTVAGGAVKYATPRRFRAAYQRVTHTAT